MTKREAHDFLVRVENEFFSGQRSSVLGVVATPVEITFDYALGQYEAYLRKKGNKLGPIRDTIRRVSMFFPSASELLASLTEARCRSYYDDIQNRVSPRTGRKYAIDTHRNVLVEARSFLKWCCAPPRRWLGSNPSVGVEGMGRRKHGKNQLRIDEARRWYGLALLRAEGGDPSAVAALMALLLGMRASEIVHRTVRDLDDGGRILWITQSKTEAGRRKLVVPKVLQPLLKNLALGRGPDELIFGQHWRDWPRRAVQRLCEAAGVPMVSAHSMRGLHSTLAMEAGITGQVVAQSLGHESFQTTITSYAQPEAVSNGRQLRALTALSGGRDR